MGYLTDFYVSVKVPKNAPYTEQDALYRLRELSGYGSDAFTGFDGFLADSKWYSCREHCRKVASEFKDLEIYVEGHGEGDERFDVDWWRMCFKNDQEKRSEAKVIPPEPLHFDDDEEPTEIKVN